MSNNYCIERFIDNKFCDWNNYDKILKADIIAADLAYYSYSIKKIRDRASDYSTHSTSLVDKFESLMLSNLKKSSEELKELYLKFLEQNIIYTKKGKTIDKEKEENRKAAEEEEVAEVTRTNREKERINNYKHETQINLFANLFPSVHLSISEKAAYYQVTNANPEENNILSNFTPNGITLLANRASYKLYYERYLHAKDYKIVSFDKLDNSCYPDPDIDYESE